MKCRAGANDFKDIYAKYKNKILYIYIVMLSYT